MVFIDKYGYPVVTVKGKWFGNFVRRLVLTKKTSTGYWDGHTIIKMTGKEPCWERKLWKFDYGYDNSFGTGIIRDSVSFAISIRGHWAGKRW